MDNRTMFLKTIELQKTVLGCGLSIFSTMQQNAEALLKTTLDQSPWLPAASKTACLYAAECSSKYLGNLQLIAEQGFSELERISLPGVEPGEKMTQQKKAPAKTSSPAATSNRPSVKKKTAAVRTPRAKTETAKIPPAKTPPVQQLTSHDKPRGQKK